MNKLQVSEHQANLVKMPEFEKLFRMHEKCIYRHFDIIEIYWPFNYFYKLLYEIQVRSYVNKLFAFTDKHPKYSYQEVSSLIDAIAQNLNEE